MGRLFYVATFAAGVLGAILPAGAQNAKWEDVVTAAKKEGSVTFYSASVGSPDNLAVTKAFEAKYGIKVQRLEARAPELRERLRTELSTSQPSADVVYVSTTQLDDAKGKGEIVPFGELPLSSKLRAPFKSDGTVLPITVITYGLGVNTQLIPENDRPKSWKELVDPKWKGKILMDDPSRPGAGNTFFNVALENLGQSFLESMSANDITLTRDNHQGGQRVARGEYAMFFPMSMGDGLELEGLPIKTYFPEEGGTYITFGLAQVKNAGHPNAALLLMNYFLEDESAQPFFANGRAVSFDAHPAGLDAERSALVEGELWGTHNVSGDKVDLAKTIFKQ